MCTTRKPSFVLCCRFGTQGHTKHAAPSSPSVMGSSSVHVTVFICALVLVLSPGLQMRTHLFPGKCKVDILAMSSFHLNTSKILQNREVSPFLCPFRLELGFVQLISYSWLIPSFHCHLLSSCLRFLERIISHHALLVIWLLRYALILHQHLCLSLSLALTLREFWGHSCRSYDAVDSCRGSSEDIRFWLLSGWSGRWHGRRGKLVPQAGEIPFLISI